MSATLIGNNVTTKISNAVSATASTATTLYTAPANSWALINVCVVPSAASGSVTVASRKVIDFASSSASIQLSGVAVGPGQAVATTIGGGTVNFYISGVEFINSP